MTCGIRVKVFQIEVPLYCLQVRCRLKDIPPLLSRSLKGLSLEGEKSDILLPDAQNQRVRGKGSCRHLPYQPRARSEVCAARGWYAK